MIVHKELAALVLGIAVGSWLGRMTATAPDVFDMSSLGYIGCDGYVATVNNMLWTPLNERPHRIPPDVRITFGAKNACMDNYDREH